METCPVIGGQPDHLQLRRRELIEQSLRNFKILAHRKLHVLAGRSARRTTRPAGTGCPNAADILHGGGRHRSGHRAHDLDRPARVGIRPMMVRSRTDLPPPDAPTRPRISPRRTSSERPSSTTRSPKPTTRSRTEIAALCWSGVAVTSRSTRRRSQTRHPARSPGRSTLRPMSWFATQAIPRCP